MSPLLASVIQGHNDVIEVLLKNDADPNVLDSHRRSPLSHACQLGKYKACRLLVGAKCDVDHADIRRDTPLIHAAKKSHKDICNLLTSAGADVNAQGHLKKTALHHAAERGLLSVVQELLTRGARFTLKDEYSYTALHYSLASPKPDAGQISFHIFQHGHPSPEVFGSDVTHVMCSVKTNQRSIIFPLLLDMGWRPREVSKQRLVYILSHLYDDDPNIVNLLDEVFVPLSLAKMCRKVLRLLAVQASDFTSIVKVINQLNLPDELKHFVLLKDTENKFIRHRKR